MPTEPIPCDHGAEALKAQIKFRENLKAYFEQDKRLHSDSLENEEDNSK
jgi:hypothetical protein